MTSFKLTVQLYIQIHSMQGETSGGIWRCAKVGKGKQQCGGGTLNVQAVW